MNKLLILADDFTGALDTGVQFAKRGISTVVSFGEDENGTVADGHAEVLVIDLESRHDKPSVAYKKVYNAAVTAYGAEVPFIYKKTDSALRGNIGAELQALLDAAGSQLLEFIPAFPKNRRTTVGGWHYIDGVKVAESVFGSDPFDPVMDSYIPDIIAEESDAYVAVGGAKVLEYPAIRIHDAETDEDLSRIASILAGEKSTRALAGCAGFAEYLPELLGLKKGEEESAHGGKDCSVLVISGSLNDITLRQIEVAKMHDYPVITLDRKQTQSENYWRENDCGNFIRVVDASLRAKGIAIIESVDCLGDCKVSLVDDDSDGREEKRLVTAENIADMTAKILKEISPDVLVVFGGDTLVSIVNRLKCSTITPIGEITSGVVVSKAALPGGEMLLVSKSGGFGGEDTVREIFEYLRKS